MAKLGPELDSLTAGDDKVCRACEELSANGPYPVAEARDLLPQHPNCRCIWVAAGSMELDALTDAYAAVYA